jgi:hypothetical protein
VAEYLATIGSLPSPVQLTRLKEILSYEPPTRGGGGTYPDGSWRIALTNTLREYRDVGDVDDYLARVAWWSWLRPSTAVRHSPGLSSLCPMDGFAPSGWMAAARATELVKSGELAASIRRSGVVSAGRSWGG